MPPDPTKPSTEETEAKRLQAEADRKALERLYGPKSTQAHGQWIVGVVLLALGAGLIAWGAAERGDARLIGAGIVGLAVGAWSVVDGLVRARKAGREERPP